MACSVAASVRRRPIGFPLFVTPVAFTRATPARMQSAMAKLASGMGVEGELRDIS
jgi:hypothetical protein